MDAKVCRGVMGAPAGFEPALAQSKCAVLPLDDRAVERTGGIEPANFSLED